jgi:very-short-patch-repair endonuclease
MNFGPLNQEGGERRLNVLITRARKRCEVFSNLRADDIDLNRTNARGVVALKAFLKYAETGILDVHRPQEGEAESPFEEAVAQALRGLGFEVHHQVGSAGFRVDLAVVDPDRSGRYLLGIECDGAAYHSARWARDRDRLRQEVLESLGWHIHRIWSTDWFRNPERELRRVVESIEKAKVGRDVNGRLNPSPEDADQIPADSPVSLQGAGYDEGKTGITTREPSGRPPSIVQVPPYRMASCTVDLSGQELHEVPRARLAEWIEEVVAVESPVHVLEVASRIAHAAGVQRVGRRIRGAMEDAAELATRRGRVRRQGDFLWHPDMETAPVRNRSRLPYASGRIERVPLEELAEAVILVVDSSVGVIPEEAVVEACRLLGYARVTDGIRRRLDQAIRTLLADQRLRLHNGFLTLP